MRRIAILQGARLASSRLLNKLLEKVGCDLRLIDRGLWLLAHLHKETGAVPLLACPTEDAPLIEAARQREIEVVSAPSSTTWFGAFGHLREPLMERFDWLVDANFLCHPFISLETAKRIVEHARTAEKPFVAVETHRGVVWDDCGRTIYGAGQTTDGVTNPAFSVPAHLAYGIPTEILGVDEEAAKAEPIDFGLTHWDRVDIDTQDDLDFARSITPQPPEVSFLPSSPPQCDHRGR